MSQTVQGLDPIRLPVRIEDVTADWLTDALSVRYPGVEVVGMEQERVVFGTSGKVQVRLEYNDAGRAVDLPERLWVKLGLVGEHRRTIATVYYDEMRFYRELQPMLGVNAPACYFAGHDAEADQSIVILEDLNGKGARIWHATNNLTWEQAAAFLDAQAAYHARCWDSPELEERGSLGWITCLGRDRTTMAYAAARLVPETWATYMAEPRGVVLPRILQDRDWMERAFLELMELDQRRPFCLLHGDTHIGNLYTDPDGRPGFLDWQTIRRGPWAHDVTYFLVSALDVVDRRRWERPLLAHYLERLAAYGVEAPQFDEAWLAYRRQIIWGLFFWAVNPLEFQPEVVNTAYSARFAMAAIDVGTREVIG
jgi:hypothetical protein